MHGREDKSVIDIRERRTCRMNIQKKHFKSCGEEIYISRSKLKLIPSPFIIHSISKPFILTRESI